MRQKFLNAIDRVVGQPDYDVLQPFYGADAVELAAGEEVVKDGGGLRPLVRAGKEIIAAAYGNGADQVFDGVGINRSRPSSR